MEPHELTHNQERKLFALRECIERLELLKRRYSPTFAHDEALENILSLLRAEDEAVMNLLRQRYREEQAVMEWQVEEHEEYSIARCPKCHQEAQEDEYTGKPILSQYCPYCSQALTAKRRSKT